MRSKVMVVAMLLIAGSVPSGAGGATAESSVNPLSSRLATSGYAALEAKDYIRATDQFETALAVDPMNRSAYIGMARAAQAQGLPGKAVKFYREALSIEPNDLAALEGQAQALLQRGATARAQVNLARIRALCGSEACAPAKRLEVAIAQRPAASNREAAANQTAQTAKN